MFINESFLSFIWQFQYFTKTQLTSSTGEKISIISPGHINTNSGPDFSEAVVRIGRVTWHGSVEIHIKSSNWHEHRHQGNPEYDNVILHVVWEDDVKVCRSDGSVIPAIELGHRADHNLLHKYHSLIESRKRLPCNPEIQKLDRVHIASMLDKVLVERFKEKSEYVLELLHVCNYDWEELSYRFLCKTFGFKINQHAMMAMATYLPFKIIKKHSDNLQTVEALLFGTAGFLKGKAIDPFHAGLKKEYAFLSSKYNLNNGFLTRHQWKFMRTRPGNFPTVRIGQLAGFLFGCQNLFSQIKDIEHIKFIKKQLSVKVDDYWLWHYDFGKRNNKKNDLGVSSRYGIIINAFVPILGAFGIYMNDDRYLQKAIELLQNISPEKNKITGIWESVIETNRNAAESQSLIQLYNYYCIKKKCLNCSIGMKLLRTNDLVLDR